MSALFRRLAPNPTATTAEDAERERLSLERERLTERFALMQSELGGLFYEMAIRDHVDLEILVAKAAALQQVDTDLAQVEHLLAEGHAATGGNCPACGAAYAPGAAFCAQCAASLASS